ncbi:MAG: hypothetical protein JKY56_14340 [Kofleriaceae bacterium]|nr:hypothetical protein [Kofleriaceae bacterium]
MGFFDSISRGWGFIKEAFAMAKQDRTLLKPSVYSIVAGITYWMIFLGFAIATDIDFDTTGGQITGAIATFGSFVIFYFFMGMTVHLVDVHLKGGTPKLSEAYADAKQNFVAIIFLALISTVVEIISKAVQRSSRNSEGAGAAIFLNIIASIIESIWAMLAFLLLPPSSLKTSHWGKLSLELGRYQKATTYRSVSVMSVSGWSQVSLALPFSWWSSEWSTSPSTLSAAPLELSWVSESVEPYSASTSPLQATCEWPTTPVFTFGRRTKWTTGLKHLRLFPSHAFFKACNKPSGIGVSIEYNQARRAQSGPGLSFHRA